MPAEGGEVLMIFYVICDEDGHAITDEVQEHEVRQMAQRLANQRSKSVWIYPSDDDGRTALGEEVEPEEAKDEED
jgi:hypothetical protein